MDTTATVKEHVLEVSGTALTHGSATRTDLLTAAVTARAPSRVIETLLRLPERSYHDLDQIARAIDIPPRRSAASGDGR